MWKHSTTALRISTLPNMVHQHQKTHLCPSAHSNAAPECERILSETMRPEPSDAAQLPHPFKWCSCSQFTPAGRAVAQSVYSLTRAQHGTAVRARRSPQTEGTFYEPRSELRTCPPHSSPRTHRAACAYRDTRSRSSLVWEHRLREEEVSAPAWQLPQSTTSFDDRARGARQVTKLET